jgi:hypothetical protein
MSETNAVAPAGRYPARLEACRETADGLVFTLRASPFSENEATVQYSTGRTARRGNNLDSLIIATGIPLDDPAPEMLIGAVVLIGVRHAKDGHGDKRAEVTGMGMSDANRDWLEQFKAPPKTAEQIVQTLEDTAQQVLEERRNRQDAALQAHDAACATMHEMRAACVAATAPEPALDLRGVTWTG